MKKIIKFYLKYIQILILNFSYHISKIFAKQENQISWVIGVDEIASNIYNLKHILTPSVSVSLEQNIFYDLDYDYTINIKNKYIKFIYRIFYAPFLLGFLANKHSHFFYIWHTGFLFDRNYEFKFLKSKNKKLVCMFVGDDIRSIKLTIEDANKKNLDTFANYMDKIYLSDKYNNLKKEIASSADKYADFIFSHTTCQMSYITKEQYSWFYMYNKNNFFKNENKFLNSQKIKILHSPSNPITKGTPLVRAAITKLQKQGYDFIYIELRDVENKVVLEHLRDSHIVLNQFYAYTCGLFGIEAMANHCAVLQSADFSGLVLENELIKDSKEAWLMTKYWQVYDNLKYLLDNPEKIKYYANSGYEFAYKYYTYEEAGKSIKKILKANKII